MAQQFIGQFLKLMVERYAEDFILLAFPEADFRVISRSLDKELTIETRRAELLGMCLVLANRYFDFHFLRGFFKEDAAMLEMLEEVPYIGEKIKEAREEGEKRGEERGKEIGKEIGKNKEG